jgi:hypothetical protein
MEDILEIYQRPYDRSAPIICMDEKPVQLVKETRMPLPMKSGKPRRYDFEYERTGTTNIFIFTEPLSGWRKTKVRTRRTAIDWAHEIKGLVDNDYPDSQKIILVCDNLNTHKMASLYSAFEPEEARRLARKIEIHYTPKHGSWLNIAEIELSALTRQCLKTRIPDDAILKKETSAWSRLRNQMQKGVNWRFTTKEARIKLKKLYPQLES